MPRAMPASTRPGRDFRTPRKVEIETGFHRLSEGSVLYRSEGTVVLATASIDETVPKFLQGTGRGWVTADYQMHPRANPKRREKRDGRVEPTSGRTREIERLIGRALRAAVDFDRLGERTVYVDCDVLEADGGTRTASITAGWIALALASNRLFANGQLNTPFLRDQVAAISVGHVEGELALDLCYAEDSRARVDMNIVGTAKGAVVEVQGTAEGAAVPRSDIDRMIDLGFVGIEHLCQIQRATLERAGVPLSRILRGVEGA
jgi:ribonuclease PH